MTRFYISVKTHKPNPNPFRLIVTICDTSLVILGKWLDYKLQQLKPFTITHRVLEEGNLLSQQMLDPCTVVPQKFGPPVSPNIRVRTTVVSGYLGYVHSKNSGNNQHHQKGS